MPEYTKEILIPAETEDVFEYHEREGALGRLTPPWEYAELLNRPMGINAGTVVELKVGAGPVKINWVSKHTEYDKNRYFKDIMVKGPFKKFEHSHYFTEQNGSTLMKDRVEFEAPLAPIGNVSLPFFKSKLQKMFKYRQDVLFNDFSFNNFLKQKFGDGVKGKVVVSGANGQIGRNLVPYLQVSGYDVTRLVRKKSLICTDDACWDPKLGSIDHCFDGVDTVIHLAGEHITQGRWTDERKQNIIESRVGGTKLIVDTIANLENPPKVLICASAVGFYGDNGDKPVDEKDEKGEGFIADVCSMWEEAARPAIEKGIRVVFARIGVVLSPDGGALRQFLLPFNVGLGGYMGDGSHYLSWIGMDDALYSFRYIIENKEINGAVNIVSPENITHKEFAKTLGRVLKRPSFVRIPAPAINFVFGQMGKEVFLSGSKVEPTVLENNGFIFTYPCLENCLRHILGR